MQYTLFIGLRPEGSRKLHIRHYEDHQLLKSLWVSTFVLPTLKKNISASINKKSRTTARLRSQMHFVAAPDSLVRSPSGR